MSYQSEAQLENNLIKQLVEQGFNKVNIVDEEGLKNNFRHQIEEHNKSKLNGQPLTDKEFERILRHIEGKTVFKSAMILRDKLHTQERMKTKQSEHMMMFLLPITQKTATTQLQ